MASRKISSCNVEAYNLLLLQYHNILTLIFKYFVLILDFFHFNQNFPNLLEEEAF